MALSLQKVAPVQGARWLMQGFACYAKRPFAFSGMFMSFLVLMILSSLIPVLGGVLLLLAMPLLSLAFMVATRSALQGGPVHVGQWLEALRGDARQRQALLVLCVLYALVTVFTLEFGDWFDGGTFTRMHQLLGKGEAGKAELAALLEDPRLSQGLIARFGLLGLFSLPFWHAPALVHWGGQTAAQALFSSTLAVWRCKGAFTCYGLAWVAVLMVFGTLAAVAANLLGARELLGVVALPAGVVFSAAFYVSLWFTFDESFHDQQVPNT